MTEENFKYRTSPFTLRNQFPGPGKWKIPIVPKFQALEDDFTDLRLIGFDKTNLENNNHLNRMVHFFLYDYKFERVWKSPDTDIERLRRYRAVLTPDFSMYLEMSPVVQLYNTFRNRWCGAYWAQKGMRVIPTVSWGDDSTFDFCFEGIEKGGTVAVSTYMVSAHDGRKDQKEFFLKGYDELLRRVEPERILCYNQPFAEMRGNIVPVDYALSSWRYMHDDPYIPSKYVKYIRGELPLPENSGIVIKQGCVLRDDAWFKGMGSAFGAPLEQENQNDAASSIEVKVPIEKFGDYIFKEGATHGKNIVFENLGFSRGNSEYLANLYREQALEKYRAGEFTLGKSDQYGQRVNIEIELRGIGKYTDKVSYLKSGWMINSDGSLSLNTPFTGFTR